MERSRRQFSRRAVAEVTGRNCQTHRAVVVKVYAFCMKGRARGDRHAWSSGASRPLTAGRAPSLNDCSYEKQAFTAAEDNGGSAASAVQFHSGAIALRPPTLDADRRRSRKPDEVHSLIFRRVCSTKSCHNACEQRAEPSANRLMRFP